MSVVITDAELKAEYERLDALRTQYYDPLMTDEQYALVSYAREKTPPVTWVKMAQYWEERGWGRVKFTTLKGRYRHEKARREAGVVLRG